MIFFTIFPFSTKKKTTILTMERYKEITTLKQIWDLKSEDLIDLLISKGKEWSITMQKNRIRVANLFYDHYHLTLEDSAIVCHNDFDVLFMEVKSSEEVEKAIELLNPKKICGVEVIKEIGRGGFATIYLSGETCWQFHMPFPPPFLPSLPPFLHLGNLR